MQGRLSRRTQWAGSAVGAALLMAGCAGPTVQPGQSSNGSLTSIDGATVSLASFENSAFPYHGMIPNYQETGKSRPFLDVDDNGRLGHSSSRGGIHWEDQTYSDRTVLLAAPQSFDPAKGGVIIVFFHGNNATLSRDVIARQQIVRQLADFGAQRRPGGAAARRGRAGFERWALLVGRRLRLVPWRGAVEARRPLSPCARRLSADADRHRRL